MADTLKFDTAAAHQYFSTENFNKTWGYIEQTNRTPEENLAMLQAALASLWHWTQRTDVTDENLSVGYWQVSRVFCLLRQPDLARTYGRMSLKKAEALDPLYKGYAYETLARAELLAANRVIMLEYLNKAQEMLKQVAVEKDRTLLAKDLATIK